MESISFTGYFNFRNIFLRSQHSLEKRSGEDDRRLARSSIVLISDRVIQPVFISKKISEDLKVTETKPSLVNQRCVVYEFQCNSCDSNYIGYTSRHLHLRIEEHKYSVIGKHLQDKHNQRPTNLHEQFTILKKCHGKFECLIYEMLLIRKKRPTLNTQNDSIPAKLFI